MFDFSYCEASGSGTTIQLWNILSNLIFVGVALMIWRRPGHRHHRYGLVLVAIASIFWHASAHGAALTLDIGAIVVWLFLYARDLSRVHPIPLATLSAWLAIALMASSFSAWSLASQLPMLSGAFIPYTIVLMALANWRAYPQTLRISCALGGLAMLLAIAAREADLALCPYLPIGSHGLWHALAALSLFGPICIIEHYRRADDTRSGRGD